MSKAIKLAKKGIGKTHPNPIVGCVIVKAKRIVGEGFHRKFGLPHAEIEALNKASKYAKGASLYVTLEPCTHFGKTPPCVDAIIKSGIKKVYVAMRDPNPINNGKGIKRLRGAKIQVKEGILNKKAQELNAPFIKYIRKGLPFVTLKIAQSLDGKIAAKTGDSKWISCEESRHLVHKLRQQVDAVMVGTGTVIKDDPLLTSRLAYSVQHIAHRQPIKIVVDSRLRTPLNSKIFSQKSPAKTIMATTKSAPKNKIEQFKKKNVEILFVNSKNGKACPVRNQRFSNGVDLKALMKILANKGIINILAEGGRKLSAALLEEKLVDRIMFFVAPKIINNKAKISQAISVKNLTVKKINCDYLFEGEL